MSGEASDPDALELERLGEVAASVLAQAESWVAAGLGHDVALALAQNALPLTADAPALPRLQRRSHGRVLTALLLLLDDASAGALATGLVEVLHEPAPPGRVLAV